MAERLRSHGVMALMEQERLLALLERKSKDQHLIRCLQEASSKGVNLRTLEEVRREIGEIAFNKLNK